MTPDNYIDIRIATPDDDPAMREVRRITWLDTYPDKKAGITREDIMAEFAHNETEDGKRLQHERHKRYTDPSWRYFIAKHGSTVVGFFIGKKEKNHNRLIALYVLPHYQRTKVGTKLLTHGMSWFGTDKPILVNVAAYNTKAQKFYEKFGFRLTGNTPKDSHRPLPTGKIIPEVEMART